MAFDSRPSWHINKNDLTLVKLVHTGRFAQIYTASWKGAPKDHSEVVAKMVKGVFYILKIIMQTFLE